jgi:hypothetical protein
VAVLATEFKLCRQGRVADMEPNIDTGDIAEVPEDQRLDRDESEPNDDADDDFSDLEN